MSEVAQVTEVKRDQKPARDARFDIAKGIGTLVVIGHHSSGQSSRLFCEKFSQTWWALTLINRILTFSVPLFLFISAILWTRSQVKRDTWKGYGLRRLGGILWPYVVWTFVFWEFTYLNNKKPTFWTNYGNRLQELLWGKASYHIYFMVVLFQLALFFPLLYLLVKKVKVPFIAALTVGIAAQFLVFRLNKAYWLLPYPASTILWYVDIVMIGVWLGFNWDQFDRLVKLYWIPMVAVALPSFYFFYDQELIGISPKGSNGMSSIISNGSAVFYCLAVAFLIIAGAKYIKGHVATGLERLGTTSLQVYLIHPLLMRIMEKPKILAVLQKAPLAPVTMFVGITAVTYGIVMLLRLTRLEVPLFGPAVLGGQPSRRPLNTSVELTKGGVTPVDDLTTVQTVETPLPLSEEGIGDDSGSSDD